MAPRGKNARLDLTGQTFGEWTVLRKSDKTHPKGVKFWVCQCSCGAISEIPTGNLRAGNSTRCQKCAHKKAGDAKRLYPDSDCPFLRIWRARVRKDCVSAWKDFATFKRDVEPKMARKFIRVDPEKPFGPENFRWVNGYLRSRRMETVQGVSRHLAAWADALGLTRERVRQLVESYGSLEAALEKRAEVLGCSLEEIIRRGQVKKLSHVPVPGKKGKQGRKPLHPWDEWTNGEIWRVVQGEHFDVPVKKLRSRLLGYGRANGFKRVRNRVDWDDERVVYFRFEK